MAEEPTVSYASGAHRISFARLRFWILVVAGVSFFLMIGLLKQLVRWFA